MWYVLFYNISSSLQKVPKVFLSPSLRGFFLVIARKGETLPKQSHSVVSSCSAVPPCLSLRVRTVVLPKQSLIEYSWKYHSIVTNYQRLLRRAFGTPRNDRGEQTSFNNGYLIHFFLNFCITSRSFMVVFCSLFSQSYILQILLGLFYPGHILLGLPYTF